MGDCKVSSPDQPQSGPPLPPDLLRADAALRRAARIARRRAELARMAAVPDPRLAVKHVDVIIRNPADPAKSWQGSFLVDASTPDSMAPRPCLEAIGLQPQGRRRYQLADGGELEMDIAVARIECMGAFAGGTVVFAEANADPILGVTVLTSLGVEIDPRTQCLRRMPAVRLKAGWAPGIAVADLRESAAISIEAKS